MTLDLSQFHYYEVPPRFLVNITFHAQASISVEAATKVEARAKVEAMLKEADRDGMLADLLDVDDVDDCDISYVSACPTRIYLVTRPGQPKQTASSRPQDGDAPREPTERDTELCRSLGYRMSWLPADGASA